MKSYPIINSSRDTLIILKLVGKSVTPITATDISITTKLTYAKVMTHIATLLDVDMIEAVDGGYIGSLNLASFWAMRKALVMKKENDVRHEKEVLGIS